MPARSWPVSGPLDLRRTLAPLGRGPGDPTLRFIGALAWRATRTPEGPATLAISHEEGCVRAEAWGPGTDWALERVPELLGLDQEQTPLAGHPVVERLARRLPGVRIPRTGVVLEALVPAILEQKVIGKEARRALFLLIRRHGEIAPGPPEVGLQVPPAPAALAALPYFALHPYGVERRRADLIRRVAARAPWFEAIVDLPVADAYARLTAVSGIGPWTAAEVGVRALGDTDAVSVGDYHLPHVVSYALAGERRGTDARMLELLEPFRPNRARVMRLLELGAPRMERRGPRLPFRAIERS